jgi:hypothetical protein
VIDSTVDASAGLEDVNRSSPGASCADGGRRTALIRCAGPYAVIFRAGFFRFFLAAANAFVTDRSDCFLGFVLPATDFDLETPVACVRLLFACVRARVSFLLRAILAYSHVSH